MDSSSLKASLDAELRFQRKQWRIERIGWVAMAALIVYSLAGGLGGGGPLSSTEAVAADGTARVRYEKFARQLTANSVEVSLTQRPDGSAQVQLSEGLLGSMTVKSIVPAPDVTTVAADGYMFIFKRLPGVANSKIRLQLEPQQIGAVEGWLVVGGGERLAIKQFVFP